jgi:hypothetical protein
VKATPEETIRPPEDFRGRENAPRLHSQPGAGPGLLRDATLAESGGAGLGSVADVVPGVSLTIPVETQFQFRNTGQEPLRFVIATMPPWPGADEAVPVEVGKWNVTVEAGSETG